MLPSHSSLKIATAPSRRGFTLVELLVAVSIIAILSTIFLGALYSAQETARERKTQATIAKLNSIITEKYESYKTRRVPVTIPANSSPAAAAVLRLNGIRELMRMEMPDRWSDVEDGSVMGFPRPAINNGYLRKYNANKSHPKIDLYQSAECLYVIAMADPENRERFQASEVGDFDQDGMFEFKDGWGNPISFLRWAPQLVSELQPHDPINSHDFFDPKKVDVDAYALFPFIFSQGADGKLEVNNGGSAEAISYTKPITVSGQNFTLQNYPYSSSIGEWADADSDGVNGTLDNIHNHMMGSR